MKNTIKINPEKFKALLETTTGKSLKEIATENGYSSELFRNVLRRGEASPNIQAVVRLYGIEPSAYEVKPVEETTEPVTSDERQLTIDDILEPDVKEVLRQFINEAVKESIKEAFNNIELRADYDAHRQLYNFYSRFKDNSDKWAI